MSLAGPDQIKAAHEGFWNWIFEENDGPNHPLNVSQGGEAYKQLGNMLIVAGSLQGAGQKDRSLRIPKGVESIFVPADNVVCTKSEGDGSTDQELITKANSDIQGAAGNVGISVNDNPQKVDLLEPHLFTLNIKRMIDGTCRNENGQPTLRGRQPPIDTMAAAACYYAVVPAKDLASGDRIKVSGRNINVTYTVK